MPLSWHILTSNPWEKVEDYRPGYPQFSAFIGSHSSFHLFRRFSRIRARLLLSKQDELSLLEGQLDEVDAHEDKDLFLGNIRRDRNTERKELLIKLEQKLASYGIVPQCRVLSKRLVV